jgi:hypothetical protein
MWSEIKPEMSDAFTGMNECWGLFLTELKEPRENALRIILAEASPHGDPFDQPVPGTDISIKDVRAIEHRPGQRTFLIEWPTYVTYAVTEECVLLGDDTAQGEGSLARRLTKSQFLDYVSISTWVHDAVEKTAPRIHWEFNCLNHRVDVVSWALPTMSVRR